MSVALHGNLRDFGIADVFQLIGQQHKTGTLVVDGEEGSIFLAFDQGCVVRGGPAGPRKERDPLGPQLVRAGFLTREQLDDLQAESERSARPLTDLLIGAGLVGPGTLEEVQHLLTKETVFDVIRRQNGDFDFIAEAVVHETKPENLLLKALDTFDSFSASHEFPITRLQDSMTYEESAETMLEKQTTIESFTSQLSTDTDVFDAGINFDSNKRNTSPPGRDQILESQSTLESFTSTTSFTFDA